jgi:hypothetical protein
MSNQVANTSKHFALLRSALRKIQASTEVSPHRFYLLNNRAKKNVVLHIDPISGKSIGSVKNPKSIRAHLRKTMSDPFEDALRAVLEISDRETDIEDKAIKRLTSCAGQVTWDGDVLNFQLTPTPGKGKPVDLSRALNMPGLSKLLPGNVSINGSSFGDSSSTEDADEDGAEDGVEALLSLLDDNPTMTDLEIDNFLAQRGVSLLDLMENDEGNPAVKRYLAGINADFEDDSDFDESMESLDDFVAELNISSVSLHSGDPELGLAFQKGALDQRISVIEAELTAGTSAAPKQLLAELAALDTALLALSFGVEAVLQERLASLKDVHLVSSETVIAHPGGLTGVEEQDNPDHDTIVLPVDKTLSDASHFASIEQESTAASEKFSKRFRGVANSRTDMRYTELGAEHSEDAFVALPDGTMAKALDAHQLSQVEALTAENVKVIDEIMHRITETIGEDSASSKANEKRLRTVLEKANRDTLIEENPDHGIANIRDTYRFKTVISDFRDVTRIFKIMLGMDIGLVKIDTSKLFSPKSWGWRIIAFDLRMKNGQIIEWYLPLQELERQKKEGSGHLIFEDFRDKTSEELKSSPEAAAAMRKSRDGYNEAFVRDLQRMNFSSIDEARMAWQREETKIRAAAAKKATEIEVQIIDS